MSFDLSSLLGPWFGVFLVLSTFVNTGVGQNTISFSVNDTGVARSVPDWGIDTAWPNFDNVRQGVESIGQGNIAAVRMLVYIDEPVVDLGGGNYELSPAAKSKVDNHLTVAALAGTNVPFTLGIGGSDPGSIDASYVSGSGINVTNYVRNIRATVEYIKSRPGFTASSVYAIEPFNEPDFNFIQANPADLNSIIAQLKTYPEFQNTLLMSPSVLNSDLAQGWFDQTPEATAGSSHLLAGSLASWTSFIDNVQSAGKPFINPEIHSMAEILVGAEHGMAMGMIWAEVLQGRGTLIHASDGDRLGYYEDHVHQSAGAVYRAPNGTTYAFAGGLERDYQGTPSAYRFVSTDDDVYFNGIPVNEYFIHTKPDEFDSDTDNDYENYGSASHDGAYAVVDIGAPSIPALDGYRWKIVNAESGQLMEVLNGGATNGAQIVSANDDGGLNQQWYVTRTRNGYYHLYNANSGLTAEVAGASLNDNANVQQWGTADGPQQQWYIEAAGGGGFNILNAQSHLYLDDQFFGSDIRQRIGSGANNQKWEFVLANPTHGPMAQYRMDGSVNDSAGSNHGTAIGGPGYVSGPNGSPGNALDLDGVNDYVQLPSSVAGNEDFTIATWVRWDGGDDWQRIFDFGNNTDEYMFLTPQSGDNTMRFAITESSNGGEQVLETDPLPVGEWVHLTMALGGNTGVLYVNGEPRVAGQILLDPTDFNPTLNYIGKSQWPDATFNGAIADFQVFDYALHPSQILDVMAGLGGGDFNGDGLVDAADYTVWRDNEGATGLAPFAPGDANGDGDIDQADYDIWFSQYGQGTEVPNFSIPEPSALALSVCLSLLSAVARRRRS